MGGAPAGARGMCMKQELSKDGDAHAASSIQQRDRVHAHVPPPHTLRLAHRLLAAVRLLLQVALLPMLPKLPCALLDGSVHVRYPPPRSLASGYMPPAAAVAVCLLSRPQSGAVPALHFWTFPCTSSCCQPRCRCMRAFIIFCCRTC